MRTGSLHLIKAHFETKITVQDLHSKAPLSKQLHDTELFKDSTQKILLLLLLLAYF